MFWNLPTSEASVGAVMVGVPVAMSGQASVTSAATLLGKVTPARPAVSAATERVPATEPERPGSVPDPVGSSAALTRPAREPSAASSPPPAPSNARTPSLLGSLTRAAVCDLTRKSLLASVTPRMPTAARAAAESWAVTSTSTRGA